MAACHVTHSRVLFLHIFHSADFWVNFWKSWCDVACKYKALSLSTPATALFPEVFLSTVQTAAGETWRPIT